MTTTVDANNSAGFKVTADTSGILQLQTNGTAALTVDTSQNVGINATPATWDSAIKALQINNQGAVWSTTSSNPNINVSSNTRQVGST